MDKYNLNVQVYLDRVRSGLVNQRMRETGLHFISKGLLEQRVFDSALKLGLIAKNNYMSYLLEPSRL